MRTYNVLILGASYGSLLATKLLAAGHRVKLACMAEEARLINLEGTRVLLPVRGVSDSLEVRSRDLPGTLSADLPEAIDPGSFDLVALAMQEPQYRAPNVRGLLSSIARNRKPAMSIMNMPPLPYLARLPSLAANDYRDCYTDAGVWDAFDPALVTLCSPDPQAFRPPGEAPNVLKVGLATNFKAARFESAGATQILRDLEASIDAIRFNANGGAIELPVKLRVHDSIFVPLAKWCMLLTGNYRCILKDSERSIRDAVHTDPVQSRSVYEWVASLCRSLGAADADLVPYDKYAKAAEGLLKPSSAARAVGAGATNIERLDRLVQAIGAKRGLRNESVDAVVATVDARLRANRSAAEEKEREHAKV